MSESLLISKHFDEIVFIYYFSLFQIFYSYKFLLSNSESNFIRIDQYFCNYIEDYINSEYSIESDTDDIKIMNKLVGDKPYQSQEKYT